MTQREKTQTAFSKSFIEGEIHLGIWSFVKKGVGLLDSFFVLSALSLYQLGLYHLLLALYAAVSDVFHGVFGAVVGNDLSRYVGEKREADAKRLFMEYSTFRFFMGVLPALVFFFVAPLFSARYGSEVVIWIRLLSVLLMLNALLIIMQTFLKVHLKFKVLAMRPSTEKLLQATVLGYYFFFSFLDITRILVAQVVGLLGALLLVAPAFIRAYQPWKRIDAAARGHLVAIILSYGKWDIIRSFTRNFIGKVRPWLIRIFLNTEAVGIFGVANMGISLLKDVIPTRTLTALIPRKVHESRNMNTIFVLGTKYYVLLSLVLIIVGGVGYPIAVRLLFPHLSQSILLFYLLLPTILIFAFIKLTNILLLAKRRQRFMTFQSLFEHGLGILLLLIFLPAVGIIGLAIAESLAYSISVYVKYRYLVSTKFIHPTPVRSFFSYTDQDRHMFRSFIRHTAIFLRFRN